MLWTFAHPFHWPFIHLLFPISMSFNSPLSSPSSLISQRAHRNKFWREVVVGESLNHILQEDTYIIDMENKLCDHVTLADCRIPYEPTAFI